MRTVKEVSEIAGISIRTLRYYDEIGLLKPTTRTEANYRLYNEEALERLQQILFFRELEIPLSDIKLILENPNYDKFQVLGTQKFLLEIKRNRLNGIIDLIANVMKSSGTTSFEAFDDNNIKVMVSQAVQRMSADPPSLGLKHFGSVDEFGEYIATMLRNEYIASNMIKAYGSREKAMEAFINGLWDKTSRKEDDEEIYRQINVARKSGDRALEREAIKSLEEHWRVIAKRDNVCLALLKLSDVYLHNEDLIMKTDNHWGKGSAKYIGEAIKRYYES